MICIIMCISCSRCYARFGYNWEALNWEALKEYILSSYRPISVDACHTMLVFSKTSSGQIQESQCSFFSIRARGKREKNIIWQIFLVF